MPHAHREPKNVEFGHMPKEAFDEMNAFDIQNWLKSLFQDAWAEYCPSVVDVGGPTSWTIAKFPKFSPEIKTRFADALVLLFDDLRKHPIQWIAQDKNEPTHNPARELFAFTQSVSEHFTPEDTAKLQNKMLELLDYTGIGRHTRKRALSTLISIGYQAEDDFWLKQHAQIPDSTLIVFDAIAMQHPQAAFTFLARQPWKINHVEKFELVCCLDRIAEMHGAEAVEQGIQTLRDHHPEEARQSSGIERELSKMTRGKNAGGNSASL